MSEMLDRIYSWDIEQLWDETNRVKDDVPRELFNSIKHGFNIPFHIQLLLKYENGDERYIKEQHKTGKVRIGRQLFNLYDYFDEIDKRKAEMRTALIDIYTHEDNKTEER